MQARLAGKARVGKQMQEGAAQRRRRTTLHPAGALLPGGPPSGAPNAQGAIAASSGTAGDRSSSSALRCCRGWWCGTCHHWLPLLPLLPPLPPPPRGSADAPAGLSAAAAAAWFTPMPSTKKEKAPSMAQLCTGNGGCGWDVRAGRAAGEARPHSTRRRRRQLLATIAWRRPGRLLQAPAPTCSALSGPCFQPSASPVAHPDAAPFQAAGAEA